MGWRCEWTVVCDQCGKPGPRAIVSRSAEAHSVSRGWLAWEGCYGRFHACPDCREKLVPDLKASLDASNEVRKKD